MILKILPAFGWYVVKDSFDAGEIFSNELFTNNVYTVHNPSPYSDGRWGNTQCGYQWLYVEGLVRHVNIETGEETIRRPGYCTLVNTEKVGTFRAEILEPTTLFCINAITNKHKGETVPDTQYFGMKAGENKVIPNGTKLFLVTGTLRIDGKEFSGHRQIHITSGDKQVEALTDSYGYIFP